MKMKKIAITFMSLILLLTLANFNFISAHETMSKEEVYTMIKEVNINDNNEIEIILNLNEDEIKNLSQDQLSIIHDTVAADFIDDQVIIRSDLDLNIGLNTGLKKEKRLVDLQAISHQVAQIFLQEVAFGGSTQMGQLLVFR